MLNDIEQKDKILNLGSGMFYINGATNIDINETYKADVYHDVEKPFPYVSEKFYVVVCLDVLEHLERPQNVVREVHRVLKQGGFFITSVPNSGNPLFKLGIWSQKTVHDTQGHKKFWDENQFKQFLSKNGFNVLEYYPSYYRVGFQLLFDRFPSLCFCNVFKSEKI